MAVPSEFLQHSGRMTSRTQHQPACRSGDRMFSGHERLAHSCRPKSRRGGSPPARCLRSCASTYSVPGREATTARTATTTCWSWSRMGSHQKHGPAGSASRHCAEPESPPTWSCARTATLKRAFTFKPHCRAPCFAKATSFMAHDPTPDEAEAALAVARNVFQAVLARLPAPARPSGST